MSILKSSVAGKSSLPITIEWLLSHGWEWRMTKDPDTLKPVQDKTKIYCCGHFLTVETRIVTDLEQMKNVESYEIFWTYKTNAALYKFPVKTFGDYDKIVEYYSEYRPKERAKIKNKILNSTQVKREESLWFSKPPKQKEKTLSDFLKITYHEFKFVDDEDDEENED